jgi:transposase
VYSEQRNEKSPKQRHRKYLLDVQSEEVQVLRKEDFMEIQALARRGVYQKDIAEELGVHPKTVSRALKRGSAPERRRGRRRSKLDGYKKRVDGWLEEGIWNGIVILRMLEELGYRGGISIVRDYIRPKRPLRKSRATVRFETPPGRQLQSDWGTIETRIGGVREQVE